MNALFITFEGLEGCGKSTQVNLLSSRLKELGKSLLVTREPGGTRIGTQIRNITHDRENADLTAVAEAYLMAASRAQNVRELIRPALQAGRIVISDRFIDSTLAYQGYGRGLGEEEMMKLNELALDSITPDVTIFLDIPVQTGLSRRKGTEKVDRLDLQQPDFYERVYAGYKELAEKYKQRYRVIDASGSIEETAEKVWKIVEVIIK